MKKSTLILSVAAALAYSSVAMAGEVSPLFGSAKVAPLTVSQSKSVTGKGSSSEYYAYYGTVYNSYAAQYASYGQYLDYAGSSSAANYYYYAYYYASYASNYYYYAYYYKAVYG